MIRINLLSTKEEQRATQARIQLILFVSILLFEVAILALMYFSAESELNKFKTDVKSTLTEVTAARKDAKDAEELKKRADTLTKQLDVLNELELKRSGPVRVLDELQMILSPPRNEEDRFKQLNQNWNVDWDPKRLWLGKMIEKKGEFEVVGDAVNADDVAEFMQRLNTAKHFQNIKLDFVQSKQVKKGGASAPALRLVKFRLTGDLSYSGAKVAPNRNKKRR